jgi:catechol 2,3-dioxygenase-like lactoylglutathione lyase family enzyme
MAVFRYLVGDVDAAIVFYTGNLGFTLEQRMGPAFAIVTRDDLSLWLSGPQSSAARAMPDGRRPEPGGWNRLVLEVDDLELKVAELKEAGSSFRNEIVTGPGGKQIVLEDGDGNPIELFEARQ